MKRKAAAWVLAAGFLAITIARAAPADAWIAALNTTEVICDARLVHAGMTRADAVRATLAAVRAKHPGLNELQVVARPAETGAEKSNLQRPPDRSLLAVDVLEALARGGPRIEITDREFRLVQVDSGREALRLVVAEEEQRAEFVAALRAGHASPDVLRTAARALARPSEVACTGIGPSGATPSAVLAFLVVRQAPDAAERFASIERQATVAGKIYARAGLLAAGRTPEEVEKLGPLRGTVFTLAGCIGGREGANAYWRKKVRTGEFGHGLQDLAPNEIAPSAELVRMRAEMMAELRRHMVPPPPAPIGFVLDGKSPSFPLLNLMQDAK